MIMFDKRDVGVCYGASIVVRIFSTASGESSSKMCSPSAKFMPFCNDTHTTRPATPRSHLCLEMTGVAEFEGMCG